jgi:hypothetical protein
MARRRRGRSTNTGAGLPANRTARSGGPSNAQGFINTYNAGRPAGFAAYGTPEYAAQFDPSQPFGTPQSAGPPPPDWQEIAAQAAGARNNAYQHAQGTFDRGNISRDYGFTSSGAIDPNNPNSRAALLQQTYQQGQRGDNTGFAAQGQLYSGAYQNQINSRTRGYNTDNQRLLAEANQATGQTYLNEFSGATGAASPESIAALLRALGQ